MSLSGRSQIESWRQLATAWVSAASVLMLSCCEIARSVVARSWRHVMVLSENARIPMTASVTSTRGRTNPVLATGFGGCGAIVRSDCSVGAGANAACANGTTGAVRAGGL